jgi:hypothetical protein
MRAPHSILVVAGAALAVLVACASSPSPTPGGVAAKVVTDDCPAHGGACVPVGSCGRGQGHMGREICAEGHDVVCCFPESVCGGPETFECCSGGSAFRLTCENGLAVCPANQAKKPIGQCRW